MRIKNIEQHKDQNINTPSAEQGLSSTDILMSREIEERCRAFFEKISLPYFEIDNRGKFSFFNDPMYSMTGYKKEEIIDKSILLFLDKDDVEKVKEALKQIYETGNPKSGFIFHITKKEGQNRRVSSSICLNIDDQNRKIGFKGIAQDISGRVKNNDELNQTLRLESIGQLAAGIAHEINTPIQFVGDNIQFLRDSFEDILTLLNSAIACIKTPGTDSSRESAIGEINNIMDRIDSDYLIDEIPRAIEQSINGLQRVSEIVQAMKQFSHPGADEKQASNLNAAIKNVVTVAKNEWKYVAEVITDLDATLPPVPCKIGEINQVILNLIINSVHAIKDVIGKDDTGKGTITISTSYDDSWAVIRVSDTGTGIPEEIRSKIFDAFFTTKEPGKGTGQGLAISHSIVVNNHEGTIDVESEVGKGTTIIVRLPLRGKYE